MSNATNGMGYRRGVPTWGTLTLTVATAFVLGSVSQPASAQAGERSGKDVVQAVCIACHGTGANGAPKIGDQKAWAAREERGLTGLSTNALNGIRKMPPHGGNPALSNAEIERAITYMVNESGGHWAEPVSRSARVAERSGEQVVQGQCVKCHAQGLGGAPKIGDRAAWLPRAKDGFDVLVRSAINGHGGMPPRGGEANLTDAEVRAAIMYMFNPTAATAKPVTTSAAPSNPNHQTVAGMDVYMGVTAAESLREMHPTPDQESRMHGGIPRGTGYYHVNISLYDATTKATIKDATVEVRINDPVLGEQVKKLEPMAVNDAVSYGNYFRMPGKYPYTITVTIHKPGVSRAIQTKFGFRQ